MPGQPLMQREHVRRAAAIAAPIFHQRGWKWTALGTPPSFTQVEESYLKLIEMARREAQRRGTDQMEVASGRLRVRMAFYADGSDLLELGLDLGFSTADEVSI